MNPEKFEGMKKKAASHLLENYLFLIFIHKLVFKKRKRWIHGDFDPLQVFEKPPEPERPESFGEVSCQERVRPDYQFFLIQVLKDVMNFAIDFVGIKHCRDYFSTPLAYRTGFCCINMLLRSYPLPGNLHKAKFAEGKDVVLGSVGSHYFLDVLKNFMPVRCLVHIDEINHNDPTHITKP